MQGHCGQTRVDVSICRRRRRRRHRANTPTRPAHCSLATPQLPNSSPRCADASTPCAPARPLAHTATATAAAAATSDDGTTAVVPGNFEDARAVKVFAGGCGGGGGMFEDPKRRDIVRQLLNPPHFVNNGIDN